MREKKVVNQRKAAVVMDTLCKLIKNPVYALENAISYSVNH